MCKKRGKKQEYLVSSSSLFNSVGKMKKAQVSQFMLIGIILLLAVSVVIYIQENSLLFRPSVVMPANVRPVAEFIEECIEERGTEALIIAGQQSGYINLPDFIAFNPAAYIPYGGMKLPYWYYNGQNIFPTLEKIGEELSTYLDTSILTCIDDLNAFKKEFNIDVIKQPETTTIIGSKDVRFNVEYFVKLEDKRNKTNTNLAEFSKVIPIALGDVHEFAVELLNKENEQMFFEQATIDLMGMNKDIPFTGLGFECTGGPMEWQVSDISREIRESLANDIQRIKVKNTDHSPFLADESVYEKIEEFTLEDTIHVDLDGEVTLSNSIPVDVPLDAYDYFHYFWDAGIGDTNLRVSFAYYPEFGVNLKVRPVNNGVMKSSTAKAAKLIDFLCIHMYHFSYDLDYPVEVMIRDDDSLNGEGYVFRYGFPVIINHNTPNRQKLTKSIYESIPSGKDYTRACEDNLGSKYTFTAVGFDEYGEEGDLDGIDIIYDCFKTTCPLGTIQNVGGIRKLESTLPEGCANSYIEASKENYLTIRQQILIEDDYLVQIALPRLQEFGFTLVIQEYDPDTETFGDEKDFTGKASVSLFLDDPKMEERYLLEDNSTINLLYQPSTYNLEIYVLDEMDELIGGYKGEWIISYLDFQGKDKIVFKALEYIPKPTTDEEKTDMVTFLLEGNYTEELKPRFE